MLEDAVPDDRFMDVEYKRETNDVFYHVCDQNVALKGTKTSDLITNGIIINLIIAIKTKHMLYK
jgi:hypothetical protein